ncbi:MULTISPECIES: molybdate ABC transporter substrate-binding protein [unclassified Sphingobium]|uniref:molybdate ABC transporter substrate-binding protein n=1 Tax=unclassified Sphingobium TaxID=2611147 RepID=UPI0022248048|nr:MULTISPECIES: molybdate ABC transporter substrate-binding protein [unclassified Sphingobium]MCW2350853.1 molybdate transport system substrate-binding protein [Sphingobium sp. B12D2B]MCW2369969.1 molybdate transport system substrate-binding protein [Sphingobium sp. B11D3D]
MTHLLRRCAVLLGLLALVACGKPEPAPQIAAAADLRLALTDAAAAFEKETGEKVVLNFGASGNLTRQLQQGAPFELFLSADESYVTQLAKAGKTRDEGRLYAIGRLALIAPKGSPLRLDSQLAGLREALARGDISRFAIANPEHAPYGRRAQEALDHAGLWKPLQDKLVLGENVSQALQFATEGGAQGGIVAHSLVLDPAVKGRAAYVLIPANWHTPLRQRMVLMKTAGPVAERFYAYLAQPAAKAIFAKYGFTLPAGAL